VDLIDFMESGLMYGWMGKILYVDLSKEKIWTEALKEEYCKLFLGARGINAKLLWDLVRHGIDPLSPENVLIFGAGTLTGTLAPSSGRTTITFKSPVTNLYCKSSVGGQIGTRIKAAGYDHVVVLGKSKKPVYIWIDDENVEIRDASHLWGKKVGETQEIIREELGDKNIGVASIGPAGENLVYFAAIMVSPYNAAARGAGGTVMGSKNLKAIAIRGTHKVELKEPEKFRELALKVRDALLKDSGAISLKQYGTSGSLGAVNELYVLPTRNWQLGHTDKVDYITGQYLHEKGYVVKHYACDGCPIGCHLITEVKEGKYAGTRSGGPEYETLSALGSGTEVYNTEVIIKANELCNEYGLDTISTGDVIQWAMECYERGILTKEDTEGLELKFGNEDAMIELIERIAYRRGKIGNLLADGLKRASEKVGRDSWKWAMFNSKGLEHSRVDTRVAKAYALAFAVNPRGPDHLHTETFAEFGASPEAVELIEKITGDKKWASPYYVEYRPEIVRWHEDCYAVTEALGICVFTSTAAYAVTPANMAEMFTYATGIRMTEEEIMLAGRRILTVEKCFNVREGADRKYDDLPWRIMHEPAPEGPIKGMVTSPEELNKMLDRYYELHEWDKKTSWPYKETLLKLGLKDIAEQLEKMGRLPTKT